MEFFTAQVNNDHTRKAYMDATSRFAQWCDDKLACSLQPFRVATFVKELQGEFSPPTVKQHLAVLRMLFDWLMTGHVPDLRDQPAVVLRIPVRAGECRTSQPGRVPQPIASAPDSSMRVPDVAVSDTVGGGGYFRLSPMTGVEVISASNTRET